MHTPNLFQFARSELSQDAFIAWLASWGDPKFREVDPSLFNLAQEFIRSLIQKGKDNDSTFHSQLDSVKVKTQHKHIDVLILINETDPQNKFVIVIEDKIHALAHGNQLEKYRKVIKKIGYEKALFIYLKTGDQSNYAKEEKNKYYTFLRKDFLALLQTYTGKNEIICQFRSLLKERDRSINSFRESPLVDWHYDSWKGFFIDLNKSIKGDWGHVQNPNGGFLGFWFYFKDSNLEGNPRYYLQLQNNGNLYFRVSRKDLPKNNIRGVQSKSLAKLKEVSESKMLNSLKIEKPSRFASGESFSYAVVKDFLEVDEKGFLDMENTFSKIKISQNILDQVLLDFS